LINPASLIGAVLGFVFGVFLFGSPFIGLIFALIGSSIGSGIGVRAFRGRENEQTGSGWFSGWGYGSGTDGPVFMDTLFSMLGRLAAADGRVSSEEERIFRSVVTNELRITDPGSVASALDIFRKAASGNTPMGAYARRAAAAFRNKPQLLEMMLIIMVRVAAAEGGLHPEEDRLMRETAATFGFRPGAYESVKQRYGVGSGSGETGGGHSGPGSTVGGLKSAYQTLGIAQGASESEIRRAYRKKASEYHPDKIAAKGLPDEFTEFANAKFQEIQKAWDDIRKAKGF
jgi:DnaJ like chaperone protein